jgi:hypothetical protein
VNGVVTANWPIALLIVLVIVGVPLWMTFKRKHARPDYRDARAHYRAKAAAPRPAATSDYVPTTPVAPIDGLTIARKQGSAFSDDTTTDAPAGDRSDDAPSQ